MNQRHPFPFLAYAVALLGIATFSGMDVLMKGLSINIGAYNALFWRSCVALLICAPLLLLSRPSWPRWPVMKIHMLRGLISAITAFGFFWGIVRVPLAEGIAISFIAPLIALYLAAVLLHEHIERKVILGSVLSFAGVVVIAAARISGHWSADAGWGIVAILISAFFYAANLVAMRAQAMQAGPSEIAFYQSLFVLILLALGAPWLVSVPVAHEWPALFGSAGLTVASLLLLGWAYARGETQQLVTVEYTAFIWASLFGYLVFGEEVAVATIAGSVLIVGGCLIATRRIQGS